MTAVVNGLPDRGAAVHEPVYAHPLAKKLPSPVAQPSTDSTEERMLSLLGRKKTLKELKNTKLVIRRLPQNITTDELTQFLDPIPDHSYLYIARGDCEFSREDTLFARAYINLSRQEDAFSFCKKLDGFPLKSAGRIYRPVFEYAPFHRVPKRAPTKTDSKEGTIESDPDFNAFIKSLHETKAPIEEKSEHEKRKDAPQTTPLIQHLIQKHKYNNRGSGSYSEPKIIKKRSSTGAKETDYGPAGKDRKSFRGPPASSRAKSVSDTTQKTSNKAGSVIIVTDKPTGIKKSAGQRGEDRTATVYDSYPAHNSGHASSSSEYSAKSYKSSSSNHANSYSQPSERGAYPPRRGGGGKKRGRGGYKHPSDYPSYKDWEYEDRGGYDRKSRYDDWYGPEGDGGSSRGHNDRGSKSYDNQRYYTSRSGRHY